MKSIVYQIDNSLSKLIGMKRRFTKNKTPFRSDNSPFYFSETAIYFCRSFLCKIRCLKRRSKEANREFILKYKFFIRPSENSKNSF